MAKVMVEPELSSCLSGFGDEERICHGYAPRFTELQEVCEDFEGFRSDWTLKEKMGVGGPNLWFWFA